VHKLITPYNYAKLKREDGKQRFYVTPTGDRLPSVTTILDKTSDKTHLFEWQRRIGKDKAAEITKNAASRGTVMHKSLEKYILLQDRTPGSNLVQQMAYKMANVVIKEGLEDKLEAVFGNEVNLYNPGLYSGTTDLVGVYEGEPAIIDFKQANKKKKPEWITNYYMQTVAYADAHNAVHGTKIRRGVILICTGNLEFQRFIVEGDEYNKYLDLWWERVAQFYQESDSAA